MRYYTTAPISYDGFGTATVTERVGETNGKPVRLVEVEPDFERWQVMRYGSGMHLAVPEQEWKQLVDYKLATEEVR